VSITTTTFPVTPYARREMAFTTFGAGYQSVWRQRLVMPAGVVPTPSQHRTANLLQIPTVIGNRSAAKPGSPPRREPR
jgi:hypothetical protein